MKMMLSLLLKNVYHSLPIQLFLLTLKRNRLILLLWILLFAIITGNFGNTYGIPYLILDPEYMNTVGFRSLFILGFSFGIFIMAFNITVYILESYRFQFLMMKENPFPRFCLNNSFLPFIFITVFSINFFTFQHEQGRQEYLIIARELVGFFVGLILTLIFTMGYFKLTGYRIFKNFTQNLNNKLSHQKITRVSVMNKIRMVKRKRYHVDYYLDFPFTINKVEAFQLYDRALITKVIDRNHLNALFLQIAGFAIILLLGYFRDNPYFQIPAGASLLILISTIIMFMGFFSFWMKGWTMYAVVALLFILNYAIQWRIINPDYQVFGLNYNTKYAKYTYENIADFANKTNYENDFNGLINVLETWRRKFSAQKKPKMIMICTSGGGQRAAIWALRSMQAADSVLDGRLMDHSMCITGASGGQVGASYFRELYLRKTQGEKLNINDRKYIENMAKDILNPVVFSLVVNDIFVRFETFNDGKYNYVKDRGYAFEKQLNVNTEGILNKKVIDYQPFEANSTIPLMLLTPTIVNDGRKLYVSPLPISFMNAAEIQNTNLLESKVNGIEFMRFFKEQDAANLGFLSALRMSATFPYITPNVNLPSSPAMEIMDAGLTDNFGVIDAVRFTYIFRDWIKKNTSGVVFLCIRDSPKLIPIAKKKSNSLFDKIFNPVGSLYANWDWIQDHNDEYFLEYANAFLDNKMEVLELQYSPMPKGYADGKVSQKEVEEYIVKTWFQRAALNWHLTKKEKESLIETIFTPQNRAVLEKLKASME
ncbi:MAG: patatin-like phospholipase family protein [Cytophagales bacterium]